MASPARDDILKALSVQIEQLKQFDQTEVDALKARLENVI